MKKEEVKLVRLAILGMGDITEIDFLMYIPEECDMIVTGHDSALEVLAEKYADENFIDKLIFRPKFSLYNDVAMRMRNFEIISNADALLFLYKHGMKPYSGELHYVRNLKMPLILKKVR